MSAVAINFRQQESREAAFLRFVNIALVLILFVKIGGYFTWSENIAITRVIKIISRLLMTGAIIVIHRMIVNKGAVASFKWQNSLSPLFYALYLLLGFASFMWSSKPGYSGLQWFMDVESLVFAYYFVQSFLMIETYFPESGIRLSNVMGNAVMLMIAIFIVGMFAAPDQFYRLMHGGEQARLGGYFMNPNELGMLCVAGISSLIFDLYQPGSKTFTIIKIILITYALIMTGSRSSTIGVLLVAFFHIKQSKHAHLKYWMYAGALMAVPVAIDKIMIKEGGLDEVLSMTGRLPFWKALITEGLPQRPWFGFGFMRIAYKDFFQSVHTYAGQMTHNTFIQVLMNLGFAGFTIVLFQMIFTFRAFLYDQNKERKLVVIGILIPIMINSLTEFGIFGETNYGILFYQILIFYISRSVQTRLTPEEKWWVRKRRPALAVRHSVLISE